MSQSIQYTVYDVEDLVMTDRLKTAIHQGISRYPVAKNFSFALRLNKDEIFSRIKAASNVMNAVNGNKLVVEAVNQTCFAGINISQKPKYCSLYVNVWASSEQNFETFERILKESFSREIIRGAICGIQWAYYTNGSIRTVYIEEVFEDTVLEEAYPDIIRDYGSLDNFVKKYLASDESILVLQGTPGTGKSRLIRHILAALVTNTSGIDHANLASEIPLQVSTGRGEDGSTKSLVLYTSDIKALNSEELYAKFIVGEEFVFVVEDADHVLKPRSNGNETLHHFLTISDGIIRNVGRKVIFTTNLPNIGDIDDALIRPGRCFARLSLRALTLVEAQILVRKLAGEDEVKKSSVLEALGNSSKKTFTLAEIYKHFSI